MPDYDLAIIGAGWAGISAARAARDAGLRVCLIERDLIGGTCLNRGCIPTKALLQSAKTYSLLQKAGTFGIESDNARFSWQAVCARKDQVVSHLRVGLQTALNGVDCIQSEARILGKDCVLAGSSEVRAKFLLLASGSRPAPLKALPFDGARVVSSDELLASAALPRSLLIVGGGVIGCEFASLFSSFGVAVTIVEMMPRLLPGLDEEAARKLQSSFRKRGIAVKTNTDAAAAGADQFEKVLVCIGRRAVYEIPGIESAGCAVQQSRILVDEFLRAGSDTVFAAGDCTGSLMLAHFAAYEARLALGNMLSPQEMQKSSAQDVPSCVYTYPEIASVGLCGADLEALGIEPQVLRFDLAANGAARILNETDGFVRLTLEKGSGRLRGGVIVGPAAVELIGIVSLAVSAGLTAQEVRRCIFAHPSLHEAIHESLG